MSYQFKLSDIGLRLIKAYEGYRPEGRFDRAGRKIIGYGHLASHDGMTLTEKQAENLLKTDLSSIEDLVNTHVHAGITQSQFDALCSLAHSIGAETFLSSDILHALNQGEIIAAANGFDAWRLGNVDGRIYVVDALVRRRTAEKALFLRPPLRTVPASHQDLKAFRDKLRTAEKVTPINIPETATQNRTQQTTLGTAAISSDTVMELTEVIDEGVNDRTRSDYQSPIAEAAAEVSERLDALMAKNGEANNATDDWPDSLIETKGDVDLHVETVETKIEKEPAVIIDLLEEDDALRETVWDENRDAGFDSASRYIQTSKPAHQQNLWAYLTMVIVGLTAAGAGLWANLKGSESILGEMGPLASSAAVAIGVLMFLMGLYYLMKHLFGKN